MRQKMAIFKVGNSVCRVQFFSGDFILYSERNEQLGAMRQKMAIFKEGNSVCRVHFFQELSFYVQKELMNDKVDLFNNLNV